MNTHKLVCKLPVQEPAMLLFGLGKQQQTTIGAHQPCEYSVGKGQKKLRLMLKLVKEQPTINKIAYYNVQNLKQKQNKKIQQNMTGNQIMQK